MYKGEKKFENLQVDLKKGDFYWIYMIFSGWGYIVLLTYRQTQPTRLLWSKDGFGPFMRKGNISLKTE